MAKNSSGGLPGLELDRFSKWLQRNHPELGTPSSAELLTGGRSNLTYSIDCGANQLILRRPPLGHVMETAHDMSREYAVQRALQGTAFPVARMHLIHDDHDGEAGVGSWFYVMDKVIGRPFDQTGDNDGFSPRQLHGLSLEMARTLAILHDMKPVEIGLEDFGRPEGYLERQVRRWTKQLAASSSRELPELDQLAKRLASPPDSSGVAIVHGDYKLNNALVDVSGEDLRVAAVLDWEMSTLGDPLADVALFGLYWQLPYLDPVTAAVFESPVDYSLGYPDFDALLAEYSAARGIEVPDLTWHLAFAAFKTGVITESIHFRHLGGGTVGAGFERIGEMSLPLARAGHRFLDGERMAGRPSVSGANNAL
jgi:aminoglycoside phosphotransferase (APT) family kinase protein